MCINHIYISNVCVLRVKVEDSQNKKDDTLEREGALSNKIQINMKC